MNKATAGGEAHPTRSLDTGPSNLELDGGLPDAAFQLDIAGITPARAETAYVWSAATGRIDWEGNAASVLGVATLDQIATLERFNLMIAPEFLRRRQDALSTAQGEDLGHGVPYRLQYRIASQRHRAAAAIWVEDQGRWWAGDNGAPALARGVIRLIDETCRDEQPQLYRSDLDELTGQLNRIRLSEALETVIERCQRPNAPTSAFLMIAVSNLHVINETFGFDVGDAVIASTGRIIKERLRARDTIGRFSSNKFGVILNDCGPGAMRIAADRFLRALRETTIRSSACPLAATAAIGGVLIPDQAGKLSEAISHSLEALDMARSRRFESFVAYEPNPTRERTRARNIAIADEIVSALDDDRMRLALQPMMSTRTRQPAIYECLLRMERPDGQIVSAGEFIQVAEQLGLSRLIDRRTLELAVELLMRRPDIKLSLNVSGLTCTDHEWLVTLHRLTAAHRSVARRLTVEITETAAIHDLDQSIVFVDSLRELGCRVAIDDFGAGYTSFKNLKHLAIDMVKIDGVFVKNLAKDPIDRIFIKTMVELARSFDMETVAEWVGDEACASILAEEGITYLQGYLFGRPLDAGEFLAEAGRTATA